MESPLHLLDAIEEAPDAASGLRRVDEARARVAGDSIFSIQLNVTTGEHPAGEVWLRRLYSSLAGEFPVSAHKRKTLTPWTQRLFVEGRAFIGEGGHVLAEHFDDYDQLRPLGLQSVVNVPLLHGGRCYATFNVFGTRPQWQPHEVLGIRWLALAAARWITPAPGLHYSFPAHSCLEASP